MLDLDALFDRERIEAALRRPAVPTPTPADLSIGPDDLPGDWRVDWEERAAILEYDGGLPRERAEALALAEIVERMRRAGEMATGQDLPKR